MRNEATDQLWKKLNAALNDRDPWSAQQHADDLLAPGHRKHLVDATWSRDQIERQWGLGAEEMASLKSLTDRLDTLNHRVDVNLGIRSGLGGFE